MYKIAYNGELKVMASLCLHVRYCCKVLEWPVSNICSGNCRKSHRWNSLTASIINTLLKCIKFIIHLKCVAACILKKVAAISSKSNYIGILLVSRCWSWYKCMINTFLNLFIVLQSSLSVCRFPLFRFACLHPTFICN